jgi:anti-anti-sigma regulatory factor
MSTFCPNFSVSYTMALDRKTNSPPTLAFVGELDFSLARGVRDALETVGSPARIDLSEVRYLDARILGEFVRLAKRVAPERPALIGVQPQIRRLIEVLALDRNFTLTEERHSGPRHIWRSLMG